MISQIKIYLAAAEVIDEVSPRSKDVIICVGEKLGAILFTAVLQHQGIKAKYICLDRLITKKFDKKHIDQGFYDYVSGRLKIVVEESRKSFILSILF